MPGHIPPQAFVGQVSTQGKALSPMKTRNKSNARVPHQHNLVIQNFLLLIVVLFLKVKALEAHHCVFKPSPSGSRVGLQPQVFVGADVVAFSQYLEHGVAMMGMQLQHRNHDTLVSMHTVHEDGAAASAPKTPNPAN